MSVHTEKDMADRIETAILIASSCVYDGASASRWFHDMVVADSDLFASLTTGLFRAASRRMSHDDLFHTGPVTVLLGGDGDNLGRIWHGRPVPPAESRRRGAWGLETEQRGVVVTLADIDSGCRYRPDRSFRFSKRGGHWYNNPSLSASFFRSGDWRVSPASQAYHFFILAFCYRWLWKLKIGFPGEPKVVILTDAAGVKEFFRYRDVPDGRDRRAALRHWVSRHWRQFRDDPPTDTEVREHLRGATSFTWFDMVGDVEPGAVDRERDRAAILRRDVLGAIHRRR